MGFMDKAKEAAEKAKALAQQGVEQGQEKYEEMKQAKAEAALVKALGEAYYAEQRHGGDHATVEEAVAALDAHHAAVAEAKILDADVAEA